MAMLNNQMVCKIIWMDEHVGFSIARVYQYIPHFLSFRSDPQNVAGWILTLAA